jgi:hypothetical protein
MRRSIFGGSLGGALPAKLGCFSVDVAGLMSPDTFLSGGRRVGVHGSDELEGGSDEHEPGSDRVSGAGQHQKPPRTMNIHGRQMQDRSASLLRLFTQK